MRSLLLVAGLTGFMLATPAVAQQAGGGPPPAAATPETGRDRITIAGGAAYLPDYEGSNDYRFTPAPAAIGSVHGYSFSLIGNRASIDLIRNKPGPGIDFQLGPVGVINFNRRSTSGIDDRRIKALGGVGTAVELGGYVGIGKTGVITSPYDKLSVSVSYRHDVASVNDSYVVTPSVNYFTPLSLKSGVVLFGSMDFVGRGYARTYESVSVAQSVASGLPVYTAHGGLKSYTLGGAFTHSLTGNLLHGLGVIAGGTYSRELNSYSYSPLTRIAGSPNQWIGAIGLTYTF